MTICTQRHGPNDRCPEDKSLAMHTPGPSPAIKEEIDRLASDHDTSPEVRRLIAQAPAMLALVRRLSDDKDTESGRSLVEFFALQDQARAILRAVEG